jgi:hypothetical protein
MTRPAIGDYAPFYQPYLDAIPDGDILNVLEQHGYEFARYIRSFPEEKGDFSYAPGKWTAKEVMMHLIDAERIFAYRALSIARGEQASLPGFDEDTYVPNCGAAERTLESIRAEFQSVRASSLHLYINLSPAMWLRKGTANGNTISVRAIAYITAGHALHHHKVLQERYYKTLP